MHLGTGLLGMIGECHRLAATGAWAVNQGPPALRVARSLPSPSPWLQPTTHRQNLRSNSSVQSSQRRQPKSGRCRSDWTPRRAASSPGLGDLRGRGMRRKIQSPSASAWDHVPRQSRPWRSQIHRWQLD